MLSGAFAELGMWVTWHNLVLLQGQMQGMDRDLRALGLLGNSDIFITTLPLTLDEQITYGRMLNTEICASP